MPGDDKLDALLLLGDIYSHLQPREGKWLTRIILKDLGPVEIPDQIQDRSNYAQMSVDVTFTIPLPSAVPVRRHGNSRTKGRNRGPIAQDKVKRLGASSNASVRENDLGAMPGLAVAKKSARALAPLSSNICSQARSHGQFESVFLQTSSSKCDRLVIQFGPATSKIHPPTVPQVSELPRKDLQTSPLLASTLLYASMIISDLISLRNLALKHGATFSPSLSDFITTRTNAATSDGPTSALQTNHLSRKMLLVESHDSIGASRTIKQVMRRQNHKSHLRGHPPIEVYDWRIIACIAKQDRGRVFDWDIWKRCFITRI